MYAKRHLRAAMVGALTATFLLAACGGSDGNDDLLGQIAARYTASGYFNVTGTGFITAAREGNTYKVTARISVAVKFDCADLGNMASVRNSGASGAGSVADGITAYATSLQLTNLLGRDCKKGDTFDMMSYGVFDKRPHGWLLTYEVPTQANPT